MIGDEPVKPQTISSDLLDQLSAFDSDENRNQLVSARIQRDIRNLIKAEPDKGYCVQGMFDLINGNFESSIKNHKRSLRLNPNSAVSNQNFAYSLSRMGKHREAIPYAEKAQEVVHDGEDGPLANMGFLIACYWQIGMPHKAKELLDQYPEALSEQDAFKNFDKPLNQIVGFMNAHGIPKAELSKLEEILQEIASKSGLIADESEIFVHHDDEASVISFSKYVQCDPKTSAKLNTRLANLISKQDGFSSAFHDYVAGGFIPFQA